MISLLFDLTQQISNNNFFSSLKMGHFFFNDYECNCIYIEVCLTSLYYFAYYVILWQQGFVLKIF